MKYYLPVFGYKPFFDSDKGDKHKMEVYYIICVDDDGNIGTAIPPPPVGTRNKPTAAQVIHNQLKARTVEVRKCKSTVSNTTGASGHTARSSGSQALATDRLEATTRS